VSCRIPGFDVVGDGDDHYHHASALAAEHVIEITV
jgi:hypothetical protein